MIVIEENHSFDQVIGSPNAPYMNGLAQSGALFTRFYGVTHPSQPNYLQFFSGSSQGVTDNTVPAPGAPFATPNLAAALTGVGASFCGWSEDLPGVGSTVASSGAYVRRHNPWVNWQVAPSGPNQIPPELNKPFSMFPADFDMLPAVSIVVPNLLNDMHDGTIAAADAWLVQHIKPYTDWAQAHNSLLIITWDEDQGAARNRIPTIFHGPMVRQAQQGATRTLHDLLRTVEAMHGAPLSGAAARASTIVGAFKGERRIGTRVFQRGAAGYAGAQDTYIEAAAPNAAHGASSPLVADGSPMSQALVRFDALVGPGAGQVPAGATILAAKLALLTGPSGAGGDASASEMRAHRMLVPWSEASTWSSLGGGVSVDGAEAAMAESFGVTPNVLDAWAIFDVTGDVVAWAAGATNEGWLIHPTGTDGWRFVSSESAAPGDTPYLEVTFDAGPSCDADLDGDGAVGAADLAALLGLWGPGPSGADLDADGGVGSGDLALLLGAWGACP